MQEGIPLGHFASLEARVEVPHAAHSIHVRAKLAEEAGGVGSGKRGSNIDDSQMR